MISEILQYNEEHCLFDPMDRVLIAVSGGIDSVVLAQVFHALGMDCGIGHCNFQLRGEASDGDEAFVRDLADVLGFEFFSTKFNTIEFAEQNKLSVQMAARELRYTFLKELAAEKGFHKIALAHNANDQVETMLMNLGRGSGLRGLRGMPRMQGELIRPLLFATRKQIAAYADEQGLRWREDASNQETYYLRNQIRHDLIPALSKTFPGFEANVLKSMHNLEEALLLQQALLEEWRKEALKDHGGFIELDLESLPDSNRLQRIMIKELLKPFGFTAHDAVQALEQSTGARIIGNYWEAERRNSSIHLHPNESMALPEPAEIKQGDESDLPQYALKLERIPWSPEWKPSPDPNKAYLDVGKLEFPLLVRYWNEGDNMVPLGMRGRKLLSDLFGELKIPVHSRRTTPVVLSGGRICWLAGIRIADAFKVDENTREVLLISYNRTF